MTKITNLLNIKLFKLKIKKQIQLKHFNIFNNDNDYVTNIDIIGIFIGIVIIILYYYSSLTYILHNIIAILLVIIILNQI